MHRYRNLRNLLLVAQAVEKVMSIGQKYPMNPPMITDCRCLPSNYTADSLDNVNWTDIPWQDCQMVRIRCSEVNIK